MDNTLFVSDLDGTLLDNESRVPEFSANTINNLIARGMKFTVATARSWSSASKVVKNLNLTLPVVTYNGAFLVDPGGGEIIVSSCFEKAQSDYVLSNLLKSDIYPLVYSFIDKEEKVSWIASKENEGIRYYLNLRKGDKRLRSVNLCNELFSGKVFYFTAIGTREKLEPLIHLFEDEKVYSYTFQQELYRDEYWLEIKKFDATKATGIEKIKKMTGCSRVISFGDSINDLPMFAISDEAYAVSNANPRLIEAATGVIESSDDNGVAKWLYESVRESKTSVSPNFSAKG